MTLPQDAGPPLDWSDAEIAEGVSAIGPAEVQQLDAYAATLPPLLRAMYNAQPYEEPPADA